jgi:hypothetical protein
MAAIGRPPGTIFFESLHGTPKDVDPGTAALNYRDAAFNVSVMADWLDPSLDEESIAWARETAATPRALVNERRLCQLHAGGRADRAGACGVRRGELHATAGAEVALRPRERAAPKPEHPACVNAVVAPNASIRATDARPAKRQSRCSGWKPGKVIGISRRPARRT